MYDATAGKILTAGGSANYEDNNSRSNAYVITLGTTKQTPQVTKVPNMAFARGFANGGMLCPLPNLPSILTVQSGSS
jgi:galactose oxidase